MREPTVNKLAGSSSPYLRQHADNPVHWQPWSDGAFEEARTRDVPVFLSIGYSSCHWCHVMENESFCDVETASFLNENYVCIKVDREERPDVDEFYMEICQLTTGSGGWPLTLFLDSERRAFFAGTYFPPVTSDNRMGFGELIVRIASLWKHDRETLSINARKVIDVLEHQAEESLVATISPETLNRTIAEHRKLFDAEYGGFGIHPKFPSFHNLIFLQRMAAVPGNEFACEMVQRSLRNILAGGIYDHIGGGIHRYSTDREWQVPHFEKMLNDQGMLLWTLGESYVAGGCSSPAIRSAILGTIEYLRCEMTSPSGAFYTAQDADSAEGEGAYYIWTYEQFLEVCSGVISSEKAKSLADLFCLRPVGNFGGESAISKGRNIVYLTPSSLDFVAEDADWHIARQALLSDRRKRPPPLTDDKILSDWNGLAIAGLARASVVADADCLSMAEKAFEAVFSACTSPIGELYHTDDRRIRGFLDDYAMMTFAAISLYQAVGEPRYIQKAIELSKVVEDNFLTADGGLFTTAKNAVEVPLARRSVYDGATPVGASIMCLVWAELAALSGRSCYRSFAQGYLNSIARSLNDSPYHHCGALLAAHALRHGPIEVLYVRTKSASTDPRIRYNPPAVYLYLDKEVVEQREFIIGLGYDVDKLPEPSLHVCSNYSCHLPLLGLNIEKFLTEGVQA